MTFNANETKKTITVPTIGNGLYQDNRAFRVVLSDASGDARIVRGEATGTILDDDPKPSLSVKGVSLKEGNAGTTSFGFVVTLSAPSGKETKADFATQDGTATVARGDYLEQHGTLTIPAGKTSYTVAVLVAGDTIYESNETLRVQLSNPLNATLAKDKDAATATILNDDARPQLLVGNATANEGGVATFTVSLIGATELPVTAFYATANGTAKAGKDYVALARTKLTFTPGQPTTQTIPVTTLQDGKKDATKRFYLKLSGATGAKLKNSQGTGTILDVPPNIAAAVVAQTSMVEKRLLADATIQTFVAAG